MPALKVRVAHKDRALLPEGVLSKAAKSRLAELMADLSTAPEPKFLPDSEQSESVTLWLSDQQFQTLESMAVHHSLDGPGAVASGLLHADARARCPEPEGEPDEAAGKALTTLDRINAAFGQSTRDDQGRYFVQVHDAVVKGDPRRVVFAEAATGTGKTRAFEAAVIDWCERHPQDRAAIAAPTYGVLLQAIHSWQRIAAVREVPDWCVIAGQNEFVSQASLQRILDEHPDTPGAAEALAWMEQGGHAPDDDPIGHRWLMRSLMEATRGEWTLTSHVQLDADVSEEDAGKIAYAQQFKEAARVRVLFCTHAMLAVEARYRISQAAKTFARESEQSASDAAWEAWQALDEAERRSSRTYELRNEYLRSVCEGDVGRLPAIGLLVVDEAHLLEQAFAMVFASGISVARLMRTLRLVREASPNAVHARDLDQMDDAWGVLRRVGQATGAERVSASDNSALASAIAIVRGVVTEVLSRSTKSAMSRPEIRHLKAIRLALDVAALASGEQSGMSVRVSWSPSVQWPSIDVGRYDVSRELDFLWNVMVEDCSVLVSATLFDDVSIAGLESMRRMLSVRTKQLVALDPIRPAWLYDPVTLHLVGEAEHADGLPRFRRPTKRDKLSGDELERRNGRWRDDVATYVARAHASAVGGTLVLLTAHNERSEIGARLREEDVGGPLIEHRPDASLDAVRRRFLECSAAGERPCLLAVGGAWTGLDLSADALTSFTGTMLTPEEDRVLTDLIIPIAPIGVNRSLTHEWRREKTGVMAEVGSTSIVMRQGIGRLVRRMGLPPNRRLHFLDSRIHESAWRPLFAPVIRAISNYRNRRTV